MSGFAGFRRFVAGADDGELSDHALFAGSHLATLFGAELEVVHAVPIPPALWIGLDGETSRQLHAAAVERATAEQGAKLQELEERFGLEAGALVKHLHVLPGKPARVLLERAEQRGADVVFLGSHARRGLLDFGSTARAILHHANCGVWVQPGPFRPIERVLAPVDLSAFSLAGLASARAVAEALEAELEVLYCFPPPDLGFVRERDTEAGWPTYYVDGLRVAAQREFERAMEAVDWEGAPPHQVFVEGLPEEEILDRQDACQLIVMGTHGRSALSGALLGNVTYSVLRHADVAVLAYRQPTNV